MHSLLLTIRETQSSTHKSKLNCRLSTMCLFRNIKPILFSLVVSTLSVGCGPKQQTSEFVAAPTNEANLTPTQIDADVAALLPFGAIAVANLNVQELSNSTVGGDLAAAGERMIPFATQIDFQLKRDVQRAYMGVYSFSGSDVLFALSGTFHPDKLEQAAGKGIQSPLGVVTMSMYAGRKLYTVANFGFSMLTEHTALVGSETAMRRALDRIQSGAIRREFAPWIHDWLFQEGHSIVFASDMTKQSFGKFVAGIFPWAASMQYIRVRGKFNADGSFGLSGAITYPDESKATAGAQGLAAVSKSVDIINMLKPLGIEPVVRNLNSNASGNDVQISTVLDESSVRGLLRRIVDIAGSTR